VNAIDRLGKVALAVALVLMLLVVSVLAVPFLLVAVLIRALLAIGESLERRLDK